MEDIGFLHILLPYLLKPGPQVDKFWITTFPKKLNEQLACNPGTDDQRVIGWGICINEELNWCRVPLPLVVILIVIGIGVVI